MKKIFIYFMLFSQFSFADCLDDLKVNKVLFGAAGAVSTGAALHIASITSPVGVLIGATAIGTVFVVKTTNTKRTIRLINEAYAYQKDPEKVGKLLSRIHKKVKKHNPQFTLDELVNKVIEGNISGSLCHDKIFSNNIASLKKDLKTKIIEIDDSEVGENDSLDNSINNSEIEKEPKSQEPGEGPKQKNPSIED
jgi:hypothetical protein